MGQTLRDLGSTIKEANAAMHSNHQFINNDEDFADEFDDQNSQQ